MRKAGLSLFIVVFFCTAASGDAASEPGNIFLEEAPAHVFVPKNLLGTPGSWRALDDRLRRVSSGTYGAKDTSIDAALPGIGWYRIEFTAANEAASAYTTAAVLKPLAAQPGADTPVALDVAMAWVPPENPETWEACARLATMAGVRMTRDRLRWRDVQPEEDKLLADTKYDRSARIQSSHSLDVLQTFHGSPAYTWRDESERGRVPSDLRHTFRFCRTMAAKFKDTVAFWEPWNEGNASNFGGHTVDELCTHQKAAYLGFRAGRPGITVLWNPLGGVNSAGLCKGILLNETWPYFDVYTIHSYDWPHDFERLWAPARDAASGREIWVTEADRGMKADPDSEAGDFFHEDARRKAEFMAHAIASSLNAGASRYFHFILNQYMEQQGAVQFGLLREDLTPRMSYVALAAAGRLLADARCLGRVRTENPDLHVIAFRARPGGKARDVLVVWTEKRADWPERGHATAEWQVPEGCRVEAAWDYLGRPLPDAASTQAGSAATYYVLPKGSTEKLPQQPPSPTTRRPGTACPVVLQLHAPDVPIAKRMNGWTHEHDRTMAPGTHALTVYAYNFGDQPLRGTITAEVPPDGFRFEPASGEVGVPPMERQAFACRLTVPDGLEEGSWLQLTGDFGVAGKPVLAFRVLP